jgi:plastocyanin
MSRLKALSLSLVMALCMGAATRLEAADVVGRVQIAANKQEEASGVVVSLTPLNPSQAAALKQSPLHSALAQKNKQFSPHLLVIPPGSVVDFPNRDPFFHNVFSLFEGKRFDLGLYESGTSRSVKFDRPGVSYIFCNIHPQMNAIVISLDTPYYSLADTYGAVRIANVRSGEYLLQIWAEGLNSNEMGKLSRRVTVGEDPVQLGLIQVPSIESLAQHKNKYGRDYDSAASSSYEPH